jgi:hypothetical protein
VSFTGKNQRMVWKRGRRTESGGCVQSSMALRGAENLSGLALSGVSEEAAENLSGLALSLDSEADGCAVDGL